MCGRIRFNMHDSADVSAGWPFEAPHWLSSSPLTGQSVLDVSSRRCRTTQYIEMEWVHVHFLVVSNYASGNFNDNLTEDVFHLSLLFVKLTRSIATHIGFYKSLVDRIPCMHE